MRRIEKIDQNLNRIELTLVGLMGVKLFLSFNFIIFIILIVFTYEY